MNMQSAIFEKSVGTPSQLTPSDLPEVAFVGRSNVGKSTLINKLLMRKSLARTSATPGKTATINFYRMTDVRLVDLPGYGYAKASREERARLKGLIESYLGDDRDLRLVIQLMDMRHRPTEQDVSMFEMLVDGGFPIILVLTKADKLNKTGRAEMEQTYQDIFSEFDGIVILPFSAVTGENADTIRDYIDEVTKE